jgi:hypothetical protein
MFKKKKSTNIKCEISIKDTDYITSNMFIYWFQDKENISEVYFIKDMVRETEILYKAYCKDRKLSIVFGTAEEYANNVYKKVRLKK